MDKLSRSLAILAACFLFMTGCDAMTQGNVSPVPGGTAVTTEPSASVITQDMTDKTLTLKVGDTFEIQLATIPTAGFNWEPQDLDSAILAELGDPVYKADSDPNSAGGIATLKFKVVGPGTTPLTLIYAAPAQNGLPALAKNSFGVTIEAK